MLMAVKSEPDFHQVEAKHHDIHARLVNWARWCNGSFSTTVSPMFGMVRSAAQARGAEHAWATISVDGLDAQRIAKAVTHLPEPHRRALAWSYIKPINPRRAAREQGTTIEGLALLVRDGRQMLVNRGA